MSKTLENSCSGGLMGQWLRKKISKSEQSISVKIQSVNIHSIAVTREIYPL